jgi:hypothetical protein
MAELKKDPKVIASAQKRLVPGERVLWAARQPPFDRKIPEHLAWTVLFMIGMAGLMSLVVTGHVRSFPGTFMLILIVFVPHLTFWTLEMMSRQFLVTDRRVIFISAFWPFRWSYWNHLELDVEKVRLDRNRKVIHLGPRPRGIPPLNWKHAVYPHHVENVPDIEAVRETILKQIALSPPPVAGERDRKRWPMPGTRTG